MFCSVNSQHSSELNTFCSFLLSVKLKVCWCFFFDISLCVCQFSDVLHVVRCCLRFEARWKISFITVELLNNWQLKKLKSETFSITKHKHKLHLAVDVKKTSKQQNYSSDDQMSWNKSILTFNNVALY